VHVGRGEGDVAEARGAEFVVVGGVSGDFPEAEVVGLGEAVVMEAVVGEQRAAVAVEAIRPELAVAGFGFGEKQLEAALLLGVQGFFALH